jgi:HD-GYP domain-containing protein (c-di-GMP phosphodiesterase class II)
LTNLLRKIPVIGSTRNIKHHNETTFTHGIKVAQLSVYIGKKHCLTSFELNSLYFAALLHDIGKTIIPPSVIFKPGSLTNFEWDIIKKHPSEGKRILETALCVQNTDILHSVLRHHEKYNGKGYPDGLLGEQIIYQARIISVADALDAMVSHRIYKSAFPLNKAIRELINCSGEQFDPYIVEKADKWNKNSLRKILMI